MNYYMLPITKKRKPSDGEYSPGQRQKLDVLGRYITVNNDDAKAMEFFSRVVEELGVVTPFENIAFIVVCHIVPTLPFYLEGLKKIGRIAAIVAKTNQDERIASYLKEYPEEFPQTNIQRDEIKANPAAALSNLEGYIRETEKIIIIDIGGYFASCVSLFSSNPWWNERLIGIVEDTENGHQDYEKILPNLTKPIYSVARCPLKETEDYNVGKSIYHAAGTIIRTDSHTYLERFGIILIIGYGKIGRSIAEHCRLAGLKRIIVVETNELLKQQASAKHFEVADLVEVLPDADMVFCATGNQCIHDEIWDQLKHNAYVASVTSADKELNLEYLIRNFERNTTGNIDQYRRNDKQVNLLFGGNAVNFVYGAVNGPYIYSVQTALIAAAIQLGQDDKNVPLQKINELTAPKCQLIAKVWNETFREAIQRNTVEPITVNSNEVTQTKIFNAPEPSVNFVGRIEFINKLRAILTPRIDQTPRKIKVVGMGGIGKTELSLKFAWQSRDEYDNAIFIQAEDKTLVRGQLIEIAKNFCLSIDENDLVPSFYRAICARGSTLVIFDNVDQLKDIQDYLAPQNQGYTAKNFNILVTSRDQQPWPKFNEALNMDVSEEAMQEDAKQYICNRLDCNEDESQLLAQTLHYFPLAITQAAAYILQNPGTTIRGYAEKFQEKESRLRLLSQAADDVEQVHKNTVLLTWMISIDQLSPTSRELLNKIIYLAPDEIFIEFFNEQLTYSQDVQDLLRYSLISVVSKDPYSFKIHRLLQEVLRDRIESPQELLTQLIMQLNHGLYYNRENLTPVIQRSPHLEVIASYVQRYHCESREFSALCYTISLYYLDHLYDHEKSYNFLKVAIESLDKIGEVVPLTYRRQFAKACTRLKKFDEAKIIYDQDEEIIAELGTAFEIHTFLLDKALFLKGAKSYDKAAALINGVLSSTVDNKIKARCHSYLASDCIARMDSATKFLLTLQSELDSLPKWQSDNRKKKDEKIKEQEILAEEILNEGVEHLQKAIEYNETANEFKEVISNKLSFINLFTRYLFKKRELIDTAIALASSLYESDLQRLSRPTHSSLLNRCAITVAQFLSSHNPTFEVKSKIANIREILKEELQAIESESGKESESYKKLSAALKLRQVSISSMFAKAPKTPSLSHDGTQVSLDEAELATPEVILLRKESSSFN